MHLRPFGFDECTLAPIGWPISLNPCSAIEPVSSANRSPVTVR